MKKIICCILFSFVVISCSKKEKIEEEEVSVFNPTYVKKEIVEGNKSLQGYQLIIGSDCLSCHKDNDRFVGPSYLEIATKYSNEDIELLAGKIIDGGSGVWVEVPMQPHPQISKGDAKKMVEYILSMKK